MIIRAMIPKSWLTSILVMSYNILTNTNEEISMQRWNWQQEDWPHFTWEHGKHDKSSEGFAQCAGMLTDAYQGYESKVRLELLAEVLAEEAFHTSEIEGEHLDRDLARQSILREFGSGEITCLIPRAEEGMGQFMHGLFNSFADDLSHEMLFKWHHRLMAESRHISDIGCYRTHVDPMQVVSSAANRMKVHYEAPPSARVQSEMDRFILWFNETLKNDSLSVIEHAALTHHHFVMIHPFEDGNGRIGRALVLKSISGSLRAPQLLALSSAINGTRKRYYTTLEACNKSNSIDLWLEYFSEVAQLAQEQTLALVYFVIKRSKFYESFRETLNERQQRVIERIFKEGPKGFEGGLSIDNYMRITNASSATAASDLTGLIHREAMTKTGEAKNARYFLSLEKGA